MSLRRAAAGCATALLVASLCACGGGPSLSKLRCRTPCQDPEQPFRLHLAVDFKDATGSMGKGKLEVLLGDAVQESLPLEPLFTAQSLPLDATSGTVEFDADLAPDRADQGQTLDVGARATDASGHRTGEQHLPFVLRLGGGG